MKLETRHLALAMFAHACVVLAVSFVLICVQTQTPSPWNRVVHEDGHRTLLKAIFYFEHAARELPLDQYSG